MPNVVTARFSDQIADFFEQTSFFMLIRNNQIIDMSDRFIELLGYQNKSEVPGWFPELIPKDHPREFLVYHKLISQSGGCENFDIQLQGAQQRSVIMRFSTRRLLAAGHESIDMLVGEDVSYQHKKLDDLTESSSLFQYNPYSIVITNAEGLITKVNPKFVKRSQFLEEEVIGYSVFDFKSIKGMDSTTVLHSILQQKDYRAEFVSLQKEGMPFDEDVYVVPVFKYGQLTQILFIGEDISVQKQMMLSLEQKAYYDDLTGFYRKEVGHSLLYEICDDNQNFSVFFMEYNSIKNGSHPFDDKVFEELLKIGSDRLKQALRKQDILIRWHSGEFVIIAPMLNDSNDMDVVAGKVMSAFEAPIIVANEAIKVNVYIGGCYYQNSETAPLARELINISANNMRISKQGDSLICTSVYGDACNPNIHQYLNQESIENNRLNKAV